MHYCTCGANLVSLLITTLNCVLRHFASGVLEIRSDTIWLYLAFPLLLLDDDLFLDDGRDPNFISPPTESSSLLGLDIYDTPFSRSNTTPRRQKNSLVSQATDVL